MSSTAERRERQREQLVDAAERLIAEKGLGGLKARDLAQELGFAVGAIYNLVEDMDELVLRVGSRTLARLDAVLGAAVPGDLSAPDSAEDVLVAVALAYAGFARGNLRLWRVLFEHRIAEGKQVPDWSVAEQMSLFRHVLRPLAALLPSMDEARRALLSRTLFSAVHGVVLVGLDDKLVAVPRRELDGEIEKLVRLVCRGMSKDMT